MVMQEKSIYLIIGLIALILFAVQTVLTFLGGDSPDGLGADDHSDSGRADSGQTDSHGHHAGHQDDSGFSFLRFFTLRNLSAFALGYGFGGYASLRSGFPSLAAALTGMAVGSVFVWAIYKLMVFLHTLESDGAPEMRGAIGLSAEEIGRAAGRERV